MKWLIVLMLTGCASTPTLQQRQDAWTKYRKGVVVTCKVGAFDPAMPTDVKTWCVKVREP